MSAPSNNAPSTDAAKSATAAAPAEDESKKEIPQLGSLEEDDEFEEFAEQDWDPSESSVAHLTSTAPGASSDTAPTTTSNLWEDNWDDDDVEEEFSKQLRAELEKQSTTMST